jgi:multidrug resistance efflux pump
MDTEQSENIDTREEKENYQRLRRKRRRNIVLNTISIAIALGVIVWAVNFFMRYYKYEITNDATVEQYIAPINSRIAGYIEEVRFTDHQWVNAGDTLLVMDGRELRVKLSEAGAALEYARYNSAAATVIRMREADLAMAELNMSHTVITAPYSGNVGRRTIEVGQLVQAGQTITNLIKADNKWITANYREKQIANIRIGQEVKIEVDAIKGKSFKGTVTAISGATGAKFSMLPTDNSAGNFVKIQQRIPVRIEFSDISDEDMKMLRAGMMVVVEVRK